MTETNRYITRVDEEVEFTPAQSGNPVEPLDPGCEAGRVDGPRGEAKWGECETAATRATKGFLGNPGGGKNCSEVRLEDELELNDSGGGVGDDEGASQIGDSVGKGDGEGGDRGSHNEESK